MQSSALASSATTRAHGRGQPPRSAPVVKIHAPAHEPVPEILQVVVLRLVDLTVVNSFISYNQCRKDVGPKKLKQTDYMTELQEQLIALTPRDFDEVESLTRTRPSVPKTRRRSA